jgi:hypothetical protein
VIQIVFEKFDMVFVVKAIESEHDVDLASHQVKCKALHEYRREGLAEGRLYGNFHGDKEAEIFDFLAAFQLHDNFWDRLAVSDYRP